MGSGGRRHLKASHSQASKSRLVPRAYVMVPLAQPPPAAMSRSPLKATIDTDPTPAVRLASPRKASSTHSSRFQSASSGRWGGQQARARPWEQEGAAGPKGPRPGLGQHSSWVGSSAQPPSSWQEGDGGKARVGPRGGGGIVLTTSLGSCWGMGSSSPILLLA